MTRSAKCNKVPFFIVELVPVDMVDIGFAFLFANFARIFTNSSVYFLLPAESMLIGRGVFSNAKLGIACFRAKLTPSSGFSGFVAIKRLAARFTGRVVFRLLILPATCFRAIEFTAIFKPRLQKRECFTAINTVSRHSRHASCHIRTLTAAKTFLLIFNPISRHLKRLFTNATNKVNSIASKFMLTNSRAKEAFMILYFVSKRVKFQTAVGAIDFHRYNII